MTDDDKALVERLRNEDEGGWVLTLCGEAADRIEAQAAEIERLRNWSLKALTVVEWVCGEGWIMSYPHYDADDLLCDGVELLGVYSADDSRAALGETT